MSVDQESSGLGERTPQLLIGPILRHLGATDATVWVETDAPCEVAVLGQRAHTFHVAGHYYALVAVRGLEPGRTYPYTVTLDGVTVWPEPASSFPPSVIRPPVPDAPFTVIFGSCRASAPHTLPYTLSRGQHPLGRGPDALLALALRLRGQASATWPQALLLLGDQVYADEVSPGTRAFIRTRRDTSQPPGEEITNFEEYAHLYHEAWQEPGVRWLLSTVATTMLWDDHDVRDDWNISQPWVERMQQLPWWRERLVGAYMAYWLYQHLGNLAPSELEIDELFAQVQAASDAGPLLHDFAARAIASAGAMRWSISRDFGRTRLLALDCRAGRALAPGARSVLDEAEWRWVEQQADGDFDHLLVAFSVPYLLAPSIHNLEAWNEAVCDGVWGSALAAVGERVRQIIDLDHWAAFGSAFDRLTSLVRQVAAGERGRAPATIVALSGDVHNSYLAEAAFPQGAGIQSRVYQAVCSPLRNSMGSWERRALRVAATRPAETISRWLAAAAGVALPPLRWRILEGPVFGNQIGTLELHGRQACVRVEQVSQHEGDEPRLTPIFERQLA